MARNGNVLGSREAGDLLGAHVETIRRLARRGEIPAYKIGKDWRFRRDALLRWAETHHLRHREPHVLVVSPDKMIRDLLRRVLEPEGCRVATASEGEEGLGYVAHGTPDLVLLDLKMPGMSGVEFLRRFRQEHVDTPVIVVTGSPKSDLMMKASRYGPIMLLPKPIKQEQLLRSVRIALGGSLTRKHTT